MYYLGYKPATIVDKQILTRFVIPQDIHYIHVANE